MITSGLLKNHVRYGILTGRLISPRRGKTLEEFSVSAFGGKVLRNNKILWQDL